MKQFKKLVSIMLATALLFSLATVALAAGTNTITVNSAEPGATYKIYQMMSLTNSGESNYSYKLTDNWTNFFTGEGAGKDYVSIDTKGNVEWKSSDTDAANLAPLAVEYVTNEILEELETIKATDTTVTFTGLEPGYYLITSTNGTKAIIASTPDNKNETIEEKNKNPKTEKQVQEDSKIDNQDGGWGKNNSAQIGQTVNFKATIDVKPGAVNYVMHDKMDDGLTFNLDSVQVWTAWTALDAEDNVELNSSNYTVTTTTDDGCTFEVKFTNDYLATIAADTTLTVTYTAVLNENAVPDKAELNKEQLTWGDKTTSTEESAWNETETTTYQFEILKYAANDTSKTPLAGATFKLYNASHNKALVKLVKVEENDNSVVYRVATDNDTDTVTGFTAVANKKIVIKGVDLDDYELEETNAPDGFNLPTTNFKETVEAGKTLVWEIANNSGTELPSTGGMGTTLFYLFGSILVVSAGVLLVTKRRMAR